MLQQTIAIIGMGMMGGSLGLAIKKRKLPYTVIGLGRNSKKLNLAKKLGACDQFFLDYNQGLKEADIVVICTAVSQIVPQIEKIVPHLKSNAVITDIGSVKSLIVESVQKLLNLRNPFVGGHPLAGSEKTGVQNADANLYHGASVVLTPCPQSSKAVQAIKKLWASVGAAPLILDAPIHDLLVAQTSHLPHVLASAFAQSIANANKKDSNAAKLIAGSFRDFTRIADSDPSQWAEICRANQNFVIGALKSYRDILNRLIETVEGNKESEIKWKSYFTAGKNGREIVLKKRSGTFRA